MIPKLYDEKETTFIRNGIGHLSDAVSCTVEEARNGEYFLMMEYPQTGKLYKEIAHDRIILAKPNDKDRAQPFRITVITEPINKVVTIEAEHISYQTSGITVMPFTAPNIASAVSGMVENSVDENPFTFTTDKGTTGDFKVNVPTSFRSLLGGTEGSLLDVYGTGEYEFDRWNISLKNNRGADSGVVVEYGKNLIGFEQEKNISALVTGVAPYWTNGETTVTIPEKYVSVQANYGYSRIVPHDLSTEFEEPPTPEELREAATKYIEATDLKTPTVNIRIEFVPLEKTEQYKDLAVLERVSLCDTVTVRFPDLDVNAKAKVVRTKYDVLKERYTEMEVGDVRTSFSSKSAEQQIKIEKAPTTTAMEQAILNATYAITGATGGYIVLDPPGHPQRILIMDTPDKSTAKNVWQWNLNGLGYSDNGIEGPYETAITSDGQIIADFITTGSLNADIIRTGTLRSADETMSISLGAGGIQQEGKFNGSVIAPVLYTLNHANMSFDIAGQRVLEVVGSELKVGDDISYGMYIRASGLQLRKKWYSGTGPDWYNAILLSVAPNGRSTVLIQGTDIQLLDPATGISKPVASINGYGNSRLLAEEFVLGDYAATWKTATIGGTTINYLGR